MIDALGTGLARPLRFAPGGFVTASGPEKVLSCVEALIGIEIGSVPWRCSLGTRVGRLRHRNISSGLSQMARIDVGDAVQRWEPRFRLRWVSASPVNQGTSNLLELTIAGEVAGNPGRVELVKQTV